MAAMGATRQVIPIVSRVPELRFLMACISRVDALIHRRRRRATEGQHALQSNEQADQKWAGGENHVLKIPDRRESSYQIKK